MNLYSIDEVKDRIRRYKLQQILDSGENDMFDDKIDRKKLEEVINEKIDSKEENKTEFLDKLKNTVDSIETKKLFECIINLKDKKDVE